VIVKERREETKQAVRVARLDVIKAKAADC